MKHSKYHFLWNNYSSSDIEHVKAWMKQTNVIYSILEMKQHLRGYVHFKGQIRVNSFLNNYCLGKADVGYYREADDVMKKTFTENVVLEFGTPSSFGRNKTKQQIALQLQKDNMEKIIKSIKNGNSLKQIITSFPNIDESFIKYLFDYNEPKREWKTEVYWFCGLESESLVMRSSEFFSEKFSDGRVFQLNGSVRWWDGYDSEKDVIIKYPRAENIEFYRLLQLFGNRSYTVEMRKGYGHRQFVAKRIYIISDKHPVDLYKNIGEDIESLLWEITSIYH